MPSIIFFADTHLNISEPAKTQRVIDFLNGNPRDTVFYILGDFFDLWIGPKHLELEDYKEVLNAIKKLTAAGVKINFIPGNRDFTVGPELTNFAGIKVLSEMETITLDGRKILLSHGDLFCTEDRSYQAYRRFSRARIIKSAYQSLPSGIGMRLGKKVRGYSDEVVPQKPLVSRNIIDSVLKRYFKKGIDVIICGHVHKEQTRAILPGKTLMTVGDWQEHGSYVEYKNGEFITRID
ncbi:MAG: UDP-2,3-diacylglucosamine diphosphatase [Planctomycetes bacterium]|nr:UDP-2,3-diacylglucosamine diphosphatase [Planctomycetota bacterium]